MHDPGHGAGLPILRRTRVTLADAYDCESHNGT